VGSYAMSDSTKSALGNGASSCLPFGQAKLLHGLNQQLQMLAEIQGPCLLFETGIAFHCDVSCALVSSCDPYNYVMPVGAVKC
jgi:hypothetical protein